jgi:hypothetical protein
MSDLLTVVTPTVGNSADRLNTFLSELRRFTKLPFRQIVSDDGTLSEEVVSQQKKVCANFDVPHLDNPPPYGVSFNLNHAFTHVRTPWAFLLEDGLRPSMDWLEAAVEFLSMVAYRTFRGHEVGMVGCASIQDWMLCLGGGMPGHRVMGVFSQGDRTCWAEPWNDGYWCWNRMLPKIVEACHGDTRDWISDVAVFKKIALEGMAGMETLTYPDTGEPLHPSDKEQAWLKWRTGDHWPARRTAWCGWYPGAFMLVNMAAWRNVGRWRDGCTFFEGHLGIRMGMAGYLSLCLECPPWLHCPSLGFSAAHEGKSPRQHLNTTALFQTDFEGRNHLNAVDLPNQVIGLDVQAKVNEELARLPLTVADGWRKYL